MSMAFTLSVLLAASSIANAAVVEINQTKVPFAITASGSYRLTSDLEVLDPNTSAITITVSNVTMNLNGFSIVDPNRRDRYSRCGTGPPSNARGQFEGGRRTHAAGCSPASAYFVTRLTPEPAHSSRR